MLSRRLYVTPSRCTACRTCELACAFRHSGAAVSAQAARISAHVVVPEKSNVPMVCLQCEEAACVKVCPTAALARHEGTGAIAVAQDKCVGCRQCVAACPFGQARFDEARLKAYKCDLCGGVDPACAAFCPTRALVWG
ncbi:MAG: 4Fe-4S dicluster domain-containing protein [Deltaproteobacteria bacterium]|nr:4Fe-4S dicluster domain-containing protein [Deltaproteobacteria bacterium]